MEFALSARPRRHTSGTSDPTRERLSSSHRGPRTSTRPPQQRSRRAQHGPAREPEPVPSTVWAPTGEAIDPNAAWPTPLITPLLDGLTEPGQTVVLLPAPGSPEHHRGTASGGVLDTVEDTVREHGRRVGTLLLDRRGPLDMDPDMSGATEELTPATNRGPVVPTLPDEHHTRRPADADLVLTHLAPITAQAPVLSQLAAAAAHLLTAGGTFAVITHSDHVAGALRDPSGLMVAAGQQADLLYLQHLVLLLSPVRHGQLTATGGPSAVHQPAAPLHPRAHADALLFVQPATDP